MEEKPPPQQPEADSTKEEPIMEVQHHAHVRHDKKWQEYLYQFFMLSLAVFAGFFAEWRLEHVIENYREGQFMRSMVHDLAMDTSLLQMGFPLKQDRVNAIDSVLVYFKNTPAAKQVPPPIQQYMRRGTWDRRYIRNSGTIDQLKNSGGMRLIRKQIVVDSIAAYDLEWRRLDFYKDMYFANQQVGFGLIEKLVKAEDLLDAYVENKSGNTDDVAFISKNPIRINVEYLNEYLNFLNRQKSSTIQDDQNYKRLQESAARLIVLIRKEYHID